MISLNSRSQNLLVHLLTTDDPVSTKELARKLGITPRMVRYSLEKVENWLSFQDVALTKRPGSGIIIDASPSVQKTLLQKIQQAERVTLSFTKKERLQILLLTLLTNAQPITAKELQLILGISRTTVLKDLDRVQQWITNFDLNLDRCQNVGCTIKGKESRVRRAFVFCLLESIEEAHLLDLLYNPSFSPSDSPMRQFGYFQKVISFLSDLDLHLYNQMVTNLCDEFELKILDRSHAALVLDIAFQVNRIRKGKCIEEIYSDRLKQSNSTLSALSRPLAAKIKANTGISIKDSELGYLIASLENASERRQSMIFEEGWNLDSIEREKLLEKIPLEVLHAVENFISTISLQLHPAIQVDVELIRSLTSHMNHIMQHKSIRKQTPNPLHESVIKQYSYVSQVVTENTYILNTLLHQELMDGEIAYISMYVAAAMERLFIPSTKKKVLVVADRSRATISLLTSRLRFEFQNLEITGIQSYLDYRKEPFKFEHDLVITTNPITGATSPVVMVNPLLSSEDISQLKEFMRPNLNLAYPTSSNVKIQKRPEKNIRLKDLLRNETVRCKVEASSWEDVVDQATNSLYRLHKIEHRYVISIKEIIRKSGPYMVIWPSVVLLHALPEDGVRELCMSLITLRSPVYFGHQYNDPVEIAIVLGAVDKTSHLPALFDLNELIQNDNAKSKLTNTFHKSGLLGEISKFQYSHIH